MSKRCVVRLALAHLLLAAGCGDDSASQDRASARADAARGVDATVDAAEPTLDAGPDVAIPPTQNAVDAQVPDAAADDAASEQAALPPTTLGNGLVLTDAAIEAFLGLTPAQRMQTARCESGAVDGGVGLACTPRGRQCTPFGLTCTADFRGDAGICTRLGCGLSPEDCGARAACCTLLQAGGVSLCFPEDCYPTTCVELFQ